MEKEIKQVLDAVEQKYKLKVNKYSFSHSVDKSTLIINIGFNVKKK